MLTKQSSLTLKKRSLILAGGGMRVAYQAGVLMALEEANLQFTHVDGTSGGIFNTAMLASGLSPKQMAEKWRTLKLKYFVSARNAKDYLHLFKMEGYADSDNIRKKVFPHLGINLKTINENEDVNATFNVCNFRTKSVEVIANGKVKEDHLLAGVSLPLFMPAIKIGSDWYTDAVWIKDANLIEATQQDSEELWLVWAIGNSPNYLKGAFHQYVHMIEMSANGGLLEEFRYINHLKKGTKLFVIKSLIPLPLDPDFFFNKINARELINMGYAHAKNYLKNHSIDGEAFDESATASNDPEILLSFRGTYSARLLFNSQTLTIGLFLYTRFAQFPEKNTIECYGSIRLGDQEMEISTFNSEVYIKNNECCVQQAFIHDEQQLNLITTQKISSPMEVLLGLGNKKIEIQVTDKNGAIMAEGKLYQNTWNRIKAAYYTSLSKTADGSTGIRAKYKAIKAMNNYIKTKTP